MLKTFATGIALSAIVGLGTIASVIPAAAGDPEPKDFKELAAPAQTQSVPTAGNISQAKAATPLAPAKRGPDVSQITDPRHPRPGSDR